MIAFYVIKQYERAVIFRLDLSCWFNKFAVRVGVGYACSFCC